MSAIDRFRRLANGAETVPRRRLRNFEDALDDAFGSAMDEALELDVLAKDGSCGNALSVWTAMCRAGQALAEHEPTQAQPVSTLDHLPPRVAAAKAAAFFANFEKEL